ncbi:MAG: nuclear transport factor 2 family protein [Actinobacteria bacterium]|nr:nuclear transport factor 2 family protein [Actinomycetota bacterium]
MTDPRLQRLLDEQEVRALSATYMRGLDRQDQALVRSVFADDATTHYGTFTGGPDEMAAMAMKALSAYRTTQHFLGQINLTFDGDTATGEVYFQAFHQHATEDFDRFICGRYIDRYAQRDGHWLMSHRTEAVDWTRTEPVADDYFHLRPHTVRGTRDTTDLSYRPHEA